MQSDSIRTDHIGIVNVTQIMSPISISGIKKVSASINSVRQYKLKVNTFILPDMHLLGEVNRLIIMTRYAVRRNPRHEDVMWRHCLTTVLQVCCKWQPDILGLCAINTLKKQTSVESHTQSI